MVRVREGMRVRVGVRVIVDVRLAVGEGPGVTVSVGVGSRVAVVLVVAVAVGGGGVWVNVSVGSGVGLGDSGVTVGVIGVDEKVGMAVGVMMNASGSNPAQPLSKEKTEKPMSVRSIFDDNVRLCLQTVNIAKLPFEVT